MSLSMSHHQSQNIVSSHKSVWVSKLRIFRWARNQQQKCSRVRVNRHQRCDSSETHEPGVRLKSSSLVIAALTYLTEPTCRFHLVPAPFQVANISFDISQRPKVMIQWQPPSVRRSNDGVQHYIINIHRADNNEVIINGSITTSTKFAFTGQFYNKYSVAVSYT